MPLRAFLLADRMGRPRFIFFRRVGEEIEAPLVFTAKVAKAAEVDDFVLMLLQVVMILLSVKSGQFFRTNGRIAVGVKVA